VTKPPFPWNGAKTRLVEQLEHYIREWGAPAGSRWIEPFLGSGVVSRHVRTMFPKTPMVVGDSNPWLMAAHRYWLSGSVAPPTKADVTDAQIERWRNTTNSELSQLSEREQALRFLVCLYSAWGNRWQTKPDGTFATPINKARNGGDAEFLLRRLKESHRTGWFRAGDTLLTGGWAETVRFAQPGDLVFLDSPYPETAGYSVEWDLRDWSEMYLWVRGVLPQGVSVLVCNPGTLSLLWELLLNKGEAIHTPTQGRSTAPRTEYIGFQGLQIEPPTRISALDSLLAAKHGKHS